MNTVPENVKNFVSECAKIVANYHEENFESNTLTRFMEGNTSSPIEQLFETSFRTIAHILDQEQYFEKDSKGEWWCRGIRVTPQCKIGTYIVDYLLTQEGRYDAIAGSYSESKQLVVELDGHAFHDRNERQRRYEKKRDRYMQKLGYTIYRYTGAEICADPFKAAIECMCFFVGNDEQELRELVEAYRG